VTAASVGRRGEHAGRLAYSAATAVEICGCPVGTIRSRVARARQQLVASMSLGAGDPGAGDPGASDPGAGDPTTGDPTTRPVPAR
jgi:hypothetical protein